MANHRSDNGYRSRFVGQVFPTKRYGNVRIVRYYNSKRLMVEFLRTGTLCSTTLHYVRRGILADPFAESKTRLIYGMGYPGLGKYRKNTHKEAYDHWLSLLSRCYNPKMHARIAAYKDCEVCEVWLNFQHFSAWFYEQVREPGFALDKDILVKGNRMYGPDQCAFVPQQINNLFEKRKAERGKYPIGVYYARDCTRNPFVSRCNDGTGRTVHLGCFATPEAAFSVYKEFKERLIREMAEKYKGRIDERVYDAMMNYEVEISD